MQATRNRRYVPAQPQSASPLWSPCAAHSVIGPMGGTASHKQKCLDGTAERQPNRGSGVVSSRSTLGLPISGLTHCWTAGADFARSDSDPRHVQVSAGSGGERLPRRG
jgi:hypothetical protein